MNKSTRNLIIVIGILSLAAGIYSLLAGSADFNAYTGVGIGIVLIGSALTSSKKADEQ